MCAKPLTTKIQCFSQGCCPSQCKNTTQCHTHKHTQARTLSPKQGGSLRQSIPTVCEVGVAASQTVLGPIPSVPRQRHNWVAALCSALWQTTLNTCQRVCGAGTSITVLIITTDGWSFSAVIMRTAAICISCLPFLQIMKRFLLYSRGRKRNFFVLLKKSGVKNSVKIQQQKKG